MIADNRIKIGPENNAIQATSAKGLISLQIASTVSSNASSFLSYGGILRVLRTNNTTLSNANAPVGVAITNLSVKSSEDYYNNRSTDTNWMYAARNPGSWANGLKICTIDAKADQRIAIGTDGLQVGFAITAGFPTSIANTDGTVGIETGYIKGIITDVHHGGMIDVKVLKTRNTHFAKGFCTFPKRVKIQDKKTCITFLSLLDPAWTGLEAILGPSWGRKSVVFVCSTTIS